jgi:hypothetical protein
MTLQATQGIWASPVPNLHFATFAYTSSGIDATGEKIAFIGRHWNSQRATKSIRRVGFLFGTVTKAGGSGLTVSLQNVDLTTGAPARPDGTQDQTVAIANADASFASDTWYRTDALSADRSVAFGELISVVIEFDGSGRLSSDAVNIKNLPVGGTPLQENLGMVSHFTASWAIVAVAPNIILEYDDGTFGTLEGGMPCSAITTTNLNTGSTPDEMGLKFRVPFPCKVDGAWFGAASAQASRDFSILFDTATVSIDADTVRTTAGAPNRVGFSEVTLAANTDYYLSFRPDTASNNTVQDITVADANHFTCYPGGTSWHLATRTNAGAWSDTTTRRPLCGFRISALDDGAGGGGGQRVIGG